MQPRTRRELLRAGAVGIGSAVLGGCVGRSDTGKTPETTTDTTTTTTETTTTETTTTETTTTVDPPEMTRWEFRADAPIALGPTVLDGTAYAGDESGTFYAVSADDGAEQWRASLGGSFFYGTAHADRSPLLADGTLYVVSGEQSGAHGNDFTLSALDPATGETLWTLDRDYPKFLALVGVVDGLAYVATSDDAIDSSGESLIAVDADSGEEAWTAEIGDPYGAAFGHGNVYVATMYDVTAFDRAEGTELWTRDGDGEGVDPLDPETDGEYVYLGDDHAGWAAAVDPGSGEDVWRVDDFHVTSLRAEDGFYVGGEHVAAYDRDGSERWRRDESALITDAPVVDGTLYAGARNITAIETADGDARWTYEFDAEYGDAAAADSEVVAVDPQNVPAVDAVDATSGDRLFRFAPESESPRNPTVHDGWVLVGTDDGSLYALGE